MVRTRTVRRADETQKRVRLVGYARVSTEEQRAEGVSLAAQRERLAAYALAHEIELLEIVEDAGISGKVPPSERPGLAKALAMIHAGDADGVVALKIDRLSRSVRDVLALADDAQQAGWRLVSVSENLDTGSATGRFTLTILAALAQLEREQVAERTRFALDAIARGGRLRSHRTPFGFCLSDGRTASCAGEKAEIVEAPNEQRILADILDLDGNGLGARRIAGELNQRGVTNPRTGGTWTHGTVASILRTVDRRARAMGIAA